MITCEVFSGPGLLIVEIQAYKVGKFVNNFLEIFVVGLKTSLGY